MRYIRSKFYKTRRTNPTGLAVCDYCGFNVNGCDLHKQMVYTGSPMANYAVANKYIQQGDVMGDGRLMWNGFVVCHNCLDEPNQQSIYVKPKGDPFIADGNRPQPSLLIQSNDYLSTENNQAIISEDGEDVLIP